MLEKIPNKVLKTCALELMALNGQPLEMMSSRGRSMLYKLQTGATVRVRTSNDPVLVVGAESTDNGLKLNISGTDFILLVMPEKPRTWGEVKGYLIPTSEAISAIKSANPTAFTGRQENHQKGTALTIWFQSSDRLDSNFNEKWLKYLLKSRVDASDYQDLHEDNHGERVKKKKARTAKNNMTVGDVIDEARKRISTITGLPVKSVKIEVRLGD
jgi:hypothetical protein